MSRSFELSDTVVDALGEVPRHRNHLSSRSSPERIVRFLCSEYLEAQESKEDGSEELSDVEQYQAELRESMGLDRQPSQEVGPSTEGMTEAQAKQAELREQLDLSGPSDEAELSDKDMSEIEKEQARLKKEILE